MKKVILLSILLIFSQFLFSQSEWTVSNSGIPEKFNTYDFIVVSSSEIYAVGSLFDGTVTPKIYKTVNGGVDWSEISVSGMESHNYLYSASCIAGNKMFINASNNSGTYAIYSSSDGSSWSLSNTGIPEKFNTYDFIVISSSEIYAVGSLFDGTVTPKIYKSVNSGADWSEVSVSGMEPHNYLYTASCYTKQKMLVNASNNTGTYAIYSSTSGIESIIALSGNLNFGNVTINEESSSNLTITNNGNAELVISSIDLPSGFSADWSSGIIDIGSNRNVNITFSPTTAQNYSGVITVNGNFSSGTNTIEVTGTGVETVGINELNEKSLLCYPNPAQNYITIPYNISHNQFLNIYNVNGELVEKIKVYSNSDKKELNISNYKAGIYFFKLNGKTNKFIVK